MKLEATPAHHKSRTPVQLHFAARKGLAGRITHPEDDLYPSHRTARPFSYALQPEHDWQEDHRARYLGSWIASLLGRLFDWTFGY